MKLVSKALGMVRVKGIRRHYLPPTRLSTNRMSILPLLRTAEHHRPLAGTLFPSHRGQEAETFTFTLYVYLLWLNAVTSSAVSATISSEGGVQCSDAETLIRQREPVCSAAARTQSSSATRPVRRGTLRAVTVSGSVRSETAQSSVRKRHLRLSSYHCLACLA